MGRLAAYDTICRDCHRNFIAKDFKARRCPRCKELTEVPCSCGCGTIVKRRRFYFQDPSYKAYAPGCKYRGQSYEEIYGTKHPKCGFKKGDANPGRFAVAFKARLTNKYGEKFHSTLEVRFSELLREHNIKYKPQQPIRLKGGGWKIVDFVIKGRHEDILVEISGFSYPRWQKDFRKKVKRLRESVPNLIMVLTYKKNLETDQPEKNIHSVTCNKDILVGSVEDEPRILKAIAFCRGISRANFFLKRAERQMKRERLCTQ